MFVKTENGATRKININAQFTTADGTRYRNLQDPSVRAMLGVVEVPDPARKDERFYYIHEAEDGSLTQTPKDLAACKTAMIAQVKQVAGSMLSTTDWFIIRDVENVGKPASPEIKQKRKDIRDASDANEVLINACTDVDQLAALQLTWPVEEQP